MGYDFDFFYIWRSADLLFAGLQITLYLTVGSILVGVLLGYGVAVARISAWRVLSIPASAYIEFFRCTPALVQIVWFYYSLPLLIGVGISPFATVFLALALNVSAFNAEAYRAAIQSIPSAHADAAVALGLSPLQRVRFVVFPQALRIAAPVLVTNSIGIFQQSSLVSLVAVADLMYQGRQIAVDTYRPVETLTTVALIYLSISVVMGRLGGFFERRVAQNTGHFQ